MFGMQSYPNGTRAAREISECKVAPTLEKIPTLLANQNILPVIVMFLNVNDMYCNFVIYRARQPLEDLSKIGIIEL